MHPGGMSVKVVKATEDEIKFFWVDEFRNLIQDWYKKQLKIRAVITL